MAREKQSAVIAEDDTILREGLRALISSHPNFDGVAGAGTEEYRVATLLHLSWITSPSRRV
jgi:DNA-binding NarL/FixJ family response regulator